MSDHSVTESPKDKLSLADSTPCIDFVTLADVSGGEFNSGDVVTIFSTNQKEDVESGSFEKSVGGILIDVIAQQGFVSLSMKAGCSEYTHYRENILKVGSSIRSQHGVSATIAELDAEWHRNQSWAQPTEHLGAHVRCKKKTSARHSYTLSDDTKTNEEENGLVWGWLPAGNTKSKISNSCSIWRVVLDSDSVNAETPVDLTSDEIVEARQRYTAWKEYSGQIHPACNARKGYRNSIWFFCVHAL